MAAPSGFYARDASAAIATLDLDLLLRPRVAALRAALAALRGAGLSFEAGGEPFVDDADEHVLDEVVRRGATLSAVSPEGARVDLMLSAAGVTWDDLARDAVNFRVAGVEVRVGRLERLLRSKQASGRPKDLEFLRLYAARLRGEAKR